MYINVYVFSMQEELVLHHRRDPKGFKWEVSTPRKQAIPMHTRQFPTNDINKRVDIGNPVVTKALSKQGSHLDQGNH